MNPLCNLCSGTGEWKKSRCPKCHQDPCPQCGASFPSICKLDCSYRVHVQYAVKPGDKCSCGRPIEWHEWDEGFVGYFSGPFLKILCNGDRVKVTHG